MSIPVPEKRISDFEKLGFGMFIHWGLYSQLGEGEWIMHLKNIPKEEYSKLKDTFTAKDFDAEKIAFTAKNSGMKYITLTTRHHEGFSLYDTKGLSDYDAPHSPAGRDLVAEFIAACRKYGLVPMLYHTTLDWYDDRFETNFNAYLEYLRNSVEILCTEYGEIGGLWFDGNWSRPDSDWKLDRLYGMIRRHQPEAIIIDNTGVFRAGEVGHLEVDAVTFENQSARPLNREGMRKYAAAEVCRTMNSHWGTGGNDFNFKSPREIIELLCSSRGCGANLLLNIGPEAQGKIPAYEQAVLELAGRWLKIFGESVYDPRPVSGLKYQGRDFLLRNGRDCYYFAFDLGISGDANVTVDVAGIGTRAVDGFHEKVISAYWLDNAQKVNFIQDCRNDMLALQCNGFPYGVHTVVRVMKLETR